MNIEAALLGIAWLVPVLVRGFLVLALVREGNNHWTEILALSCCLGVAIVPLECIVIATIGKITSLSLWASSLGSILACVLVLRYVKGNWGVRSIVAHFRTNESRREFLATTLFVVFPLVLSLWNWNDAVGIHSVDMGTHVFWAKRVTLTGSLPDYSIIQPFDEPYKFAFGGHVFLAEVALLTGLDLERYFWLVPLFISLLTQINIFVLTKKIANSRIAGVAAALLFGLMFNPGGYIQRGNLPDIVGYYCVSSIALVFVVLRGSVATLLTSILVLSSFTYHQYSSAIAVLMSALFLAAKLISKPRKAILHIANLIRSKNSLLGLSFVLVLAALTVPELTYVNSKIIGLVGSPSYTNQWQSWVTSLDRYPGTIGATLFWAGICGMVLLIMTRPSESLGIACWLAALLLLANAPLLGLGIPEPYRFVWRMTEPLAVAAGAVLGSLALLAKKSMNIRIQFPDRSTAVKIRNPWVIPLIVWIFVMGVAVADAIPNRYRVLEPYLSTDRELGSWLGVNAEEGGTAIANVDTDNVATWLQAYSMRPHFLYSVALGTAISPDTHRGVYVDLATLFSNPASPVVRGLIEKYNIAYAIAVGTDVTKFDNSEFFRRVYSVPQGAIFEPITAPNYGVASYSGWLLPTTSGRHVLLLTSITILYNASQRVELTIPIHSHVTVPPTPDTVLNVTVDGVLDQTIHIPKGTLTDRHVGYEQHWPSFSESGVGETYVLRLPIHPGSHVIEMEYVADIDFEIYLQDLISNAISLEGE